MNRLLVVVLLAAAVAEGAKLNRGRSFGRSSGGRGRGFGRNLDAGAPSDSYSAPPSSSPVGPNGDAGYGGGPQGDAGYGGDLGAAASTRFDVGAEEDPIAALGANIPGGGIPGEDYPILSSVPDTGFLCEDLEFPGYYADTADEAGCQVFHICQEDFRLDSFLCPNGTIFNQQYFVCDWWFNVDCAASEDFYALNGDIGVAPGDELLREGASSLDSAYAPPATNGGYDNGAPADAGFPDYDYGAAPEAPVDSYGAPPAAADPVAAPDQLYSAPDAGAGRSLGRRRNGGRRNGGRSNNRGRSFRG